MASSYVQKVIRSVKKNNPHQPEFIQALEEVLHSLEPLFLKDPKYQQNGIRSEGIMRVGYHAFRGEASVYSSVSRHCVKAGIRVD